MIECGANCALAVEEKGFDAENRQIKQVEDYVDCKT
jgi:hypothetical protein